MRESCLEERKFFGSGGPKRKTSVVLKEINDGVMDCCEGAFERLAAMLEAVDIRMGASVENEFGSQPTRIGKHLDGDTIGPKGQNDDERKRLG